ncbi:EamA family transporter [Enorma massiliensis]
MGPNLEATSYIYVTIFGIVFFNEKMSRKKWIALVLIITGIALYSIGA